MALLEFCTDNSGALEAAARSGADRIELCCALPLGGLTPSVGQMRLAGQVRLPVHVMIRPRSGDFHYDRAEADMMIADIYEAAQAGMAGIVIGATRADMMPDSLLLEELIGHIRKAGAAVGRNLATTFHRAIDLCPDMLAAVDSVCDLGFSHILSSGGAAAAQEGLAMLAAMRERAGERCTLIAASGISPANAGTIARATSISEFHASCRVPVKNAESSKLVALGFIETPEREVDFDRLRELKSVLTAMAPTS